MTVDEKWIVLKNLLNDEHEFTKILEIITNPWSKSWSQNQSLQDFQNIDNFSKTFDRWIRMQTQPFISMKIIEDVSISKQDNISQSNSPLPSEIPLNSQPAYTYTKKKVTPMVLSACLPSNFGQSLASNNNPQKQLPPAQTNEWPSLSETSNSVKQVRVQGKKKRITPTLTPNKPSEDSQNMNFPSPPVPTLVHQMSVSVKSNFDQLGIVVHVVETKKELEPPPNPLGGDHSLAISIARLARIWAALIKSNFLPIIPAVLYLSRLLTSRHTCITTGKEIVVSILNPHFPSYFLNDESLGIFLTEASLLLSDIIQSLGEHFCGIYADLVLEISPIVSHSLLHRSRRSSSFTNDQYTELYPYFVQDQSTTVDREEFIRPFHEERDNRHEYKGKTEGVVYNEREKCFDEFSNLFRRYSEINRSDMDGSKTEEFWPTVAQILSLSDCNFIWFAQIFKDMLLFHGTNLPKIPVEASENFQPSGSISERTSSHPGTSQFRQLEERLGPGGSAQSTHPKRQNQSNENQRFTQLLSVLKDPSAVFPGFQQFFFRFIVMMDSAKLNHYLSDVFLEEILNLTDVLSSGEYHNFLQQMRSGDLERDSLTDELLKNKESATSNRSLKYSLLPMREVMESSKKHLSFNIRILQLRILGKFLGLVHSFPYWTLSLSGSNTITNSPLFEMISRAAIFRNSVDCSVSLPLSKLLYLSWQDSTLTLTVSWIVNYLRMTAWDVTSILYNRSDQCFLTTKSEHISTIAIMASILSSQEYRLSHGYIPRNRLYVHLEIQSLFSEISSINRLISDLPLIQIPTRAKNISSIDEGEAAFSEIFMKHVIPSLHEMYITLQQRKGWANNYAKRRSTVPDPMITLKRLTPTTTLPVSSTLNLAVTPRGNLSSTSLLITPEKSDNREPSIATKLENAFWQSYPYLQQLYSNFVQHLNSSCQKKLREKVADMVVSAWNICEGIKKEHPDLLEREFESLLSSQMDAYRNSSTTEVEAYLGELISFHFEKTLHIQFQMYSLSPGVLSTAIKLTNQHQATILGTNLNFFLTYAQKKLNEVQVICQQKVKFEKKNLLLKNSKLSKLLFEPSILISDIDSLYHELDEVFCQYIAPTSEKKSIEQPATIRDLYQIHRLPPSIGEPDSSPITPLEEKLSLIFRTRLCSLHIVPINQLVTFTWLSVHKLCGTLCRFITQLIHSLNKLILYQITSVNGQVSHLMDLSHSIPIMIQNITKFLSIVQEWCFTSTTATTSLLSQESIGRVKIEFNKLYLEIQPSLLYYTFYLQSNSTSSDHCNDTTSVLPSHVILGAYQFHLITIRTINRLLFTTIKSNQNLFVLFETFPIEQSLFSLLKEFFLQFYFSENLKNLLCSDDWYSMKNSEQLLINLKQNNLSNEFIYLFEQLIQRYHEKYMSE